jgi:hypothetical protein
MISGKVRQATDKVYAGFPEEERKCKEYVLLDFHLTSFSVVTLHPFTPFIFAIHWISTYLCIYGQRRRG